MEKSKNGFKIDAPRPPATGLVEFKVGVMREGFISSDVKHKPLNKSQEYYENYAHCEGSPPLETDQGREILKRKLWRFVIPPNIGN
jgi:hypothetical protein